MANQLGKNPHVETTGYTHGEKKMKQIYTLHGN